MNYQVDNWSVTSQWSLSHWDLSGHWELVIGHSLASGQSSGVSVRPRQWSLSHWDLSGHWELVIGHLHLVTGHLRKNINHAPI